MIPAVLDSGVLSAWAAGDRRIIAGLEAVRRAGGYVVVPTVVVAESTTGVPGRDASVNRRVKGTVLDVCDERRARRAGALRYASGAAADISVVDAVVAATGEDLGARVLTDDPIDLRRLATASGRLDVVALEDLG
ncbi:MAG TPA: PIN domain-containing protein [Egibacteraceae bacterium]|nr:PIN domain-containing protein [Actinomycetota bacterium]HWB73270.1 PIN domain-containing protein [Egibacteraceae bacterium]